MKFVNITDDLKAAFAEAYPAVKIESEISAAAMWIVAHPANRKSNWLSYLTNWLKRAQDRAPRVDGANGATKTPAWSDSADGVKAKAIELGIEFKGKTQKKLAEECDNLIYARLLAARTGQPVETFL